MSDPRRRRYVEAARRLFAAYVSWHEGMSFEQAYEKYAISSADIGDYWIDLAERVDREMMALRVKTARLRQKEGA